ncbi:MAG: energy transducer TonB [Phycisphaerales bacterium]|nr:energy transducer TonB [Phycisphaerales bacterium]
MTTNTCNPVVRIEFDAAGTPVRASILRTSCDDRFDRALLASLYRWRAEGKALDDLAHDQTTSITLEILLR